MKKITIMIRLREELFFRTSVWVAQAWHLVRCLQRMASQKLKQRGMALVVFPMVNLGQSLSSGCFFQAGTVIWKHSTPNLLWINILV